jgi:hypothetical protein
MDDGVSKEATAGRAEPMLDDAAADRRDAVETAIIAHLYSNITTLLITSTVVAMFVLYTMWDAVPPMWLGAWFVGLAG